MADRDSVVIFGWAILINASIRAEITKGKAPKSSRRNSPEEIPRSRQTASAWERIVSLDRVSTLPDSSIDKDFFEGV